MSTYLSGVSKLTPRAPRSSLTAFVFLVLSIVVLQSPLLAQSNDDCLACHSDRSMTMEKSGKEVSIFVDGTLLQRSPHTKLACVACHRGFDKDNVPHKEKITPVNCMSCHGDAPQKHAFHPQMIKATGTNGTPDISCKQCHGTHDILSPQDPLTATNPNNQPEFCGKCHPRVKEAFLNSAHGGALLADVKGAPSCVRCHVNDITQIRPGRDSVQVKTAQEKVCLTCHLDNPDVRNRVAPSAGFIASYEQSVHGAALNGGNAKAANCVDCHGAHEMKKGNNPASHVNRTHIPETCSKCHSTVAAEFAGSIHGTAFRRGNTDAPVCTDCHGEHNILAPSNPKSPVAAKNVSAQVCSPCHSSVKLTAKYGISSDRFSTFSDSYHGLAIRGGSIEVANCTSCHGVHDIKPSSDSTSRTNKANLSAICGKCHPGANERFAIGQVHVNLSEEGKEPSLYWIATLYLILIVVVVGGMFFHNFIDFLKKSRRKLLVRRGIIPEEHVGHRLYLRMSRSERLQHGSLLVSFTLLVITGFMLHYPDAWWVKSLRDLSNDVFDLRSLVHRIAAVVMVAASLYHLYYIFFTERGKSLIRDLMPRLQDVRDAVGVLKYNLGFSPIKPKFGRFSYIEKSEYWALVWGTMVMAVTGFIMWFDNTFIGLLTKLGYDVARLIHFYEAWLATLAILVWHFYYVMFNPDTYPINLAFWTGTLTEAEMKEEHPLELEARKREEVEEGIISVSTGENDAPRGSGKS